MIFPFLWLVLVSRNGGVYVVFGRVWSTGWDTAILNTLVMLSTRYVAACSTGLVCFSRRWSVQDVVFKTPGAQLSWYRGGVFKRSSVGEQFHEKNHMNGKPRASGTQRPSCREQIYSPPSPRMTMETFCWGCSLIWRVVQVVSIKLCGLWDSHILTMCRSSPWCPNFTETLISLTRSFPLSLSELVGTEIQTAMADNIDTTSFYP